MPAREVALQGVMIQMLAHGLSSGGLFILCGELYERLHTHDLRKMGGLWARFSYLPPIALFFTAASLGLPGLGNFLGEFLILLGTFKPHPSVTVVATGGLILSAVYSLILMQRAFHGKPSGENELAGFEPPGNCCARYHNGIPDLAGPVSAADPRRVECVDAGIADAVCAGGGRSPRRICRARTAMTPQQLFAVSPIVIAGLTVVAVMLAIAIKRHHGWTAKISMTGLGLALLPLLVRCGCRTFSLFRRRKPSRRCCESTTMPASTWRWCS